MSLPYVSVPVLSNITTFVFSAFSSISLFFINIPFDADKPSLTIIASGVASPSAQGQATTKIVTKVIIAVSKLYPKHKYAINVSIASTITIGTKYPDTVSATFAIGAFVFVASTTSFTISDTVDSFPILSALYSRYPS